MPANLTPQYLEAERHFRAAKTPEEKINALQAMLAVMPKHKGTDHLHAELRRKIAKIQEDAERKNATSKSSFYIRKEGSGQVILIGLPNSGKSQLLSAVTDASPEIGDYPYTTKSPNIGMMKFENIQIQIVDTPAITIRESYIWLNSIIRNADLIAIVLDLAESPVEQIETVLSELDSMNIIPATNTTQQLEDKQAKKMVLIGNKIDLEYAPLYYHEVIEKYGKKLPAIAISSKQGDHLDELKKTIFNLLNIIRVHTKSPGFKPKLNDPMIMKKGSTLKDAAEAVHKDFRAKLKYALVWGSGKFDGQRISPDHILQDNDIIELHI